MGSSHHLYHFLHLYVHKAATLCFLSVWTLCSPKSVKGRLCVNEKLVVSLGGTLIYELYGYVPL